MDYLQEVFALGLDLLFFGYCVKEYISFKRTIKLLQNTPQLTIDKSLIEYVASQVNKKVPYVAIRGRVAPLDSPIVSTMQPNITGVLQIIEKKEHHIIRGFAGFWGEQEKLVHSASNEVPFLLKNGDVGVEIVNGLSAAVLNLDVIYDKYETVKLSAIETLFGFITGIRQRGLQTTERILRDGNLITAIGELELDGDTLRLQRSPLGPLYLITSSKVTFIHKFEEKKYGIILRMAVYGSVAVFIIAVIIKRFLAKRKEEREKLSMHAAIEEQRRKRRALSRPTNLSVEQSCVVCTINPKEVIVLPCGHVCMCEDCSVQVKENCPLCRSRIVSRAAAFIS